MAYDAVNEDRELTKIVEEMFVSYVLHLDEQRSRFSAKDYNSLPTRRPHIPENIILHSNGRDSFEFQREKTDFEF